MSIKCVLLQTAKLLKEAGFRQDTEFYWNNPVTGDTYKDKPEWKLEDFCFDEEFTGYSFPAPTTDELLEELPCDTQGYALVIYKIDTEKMYWVSYFNDFKKKDLKTFKNESLPEALAQMWLWLHKEGLLKGNGNGDKA